MKIEIYSYLRLPRLSSLTPEFLLHYHIKQIFLNSEGTQLGLRERMTEMKSRYGCMEERSIIYGHLSSRHRAPRAAKQIIFITVVIVASMALLCLMRRNRRASLRNFLFPVSLKKAVFLKKPTEFSSALNCKSISLWRLLPRVHFLGRRVVLDGIDQLDLFRMLMLSDVCGALRGGRRESGGVGAK